MKASVIDVRELRTHLVTRRSTIKAVDGVSFTVAEGETLGLVARALALSPKLVVPDEPVSARDVSIRAQILNLLRDLQKRLGVAYLFIAHDLAAVAHMSHAIAVMYLGKIVELGAATDVALRPKHPYTQALFSAALPLERRDRREEIILSGEIPSPLAPPPGCHFHTRCPQVMDRCRHDEPPQASESGRLIACHLYPAPAAARERPVDPAPAGKRRIDKACRPRIIGTASGSVRRSSASLPNDSRTQRRILMTERVLLRPLSLSALILAALLLVSLLVPTKARSEAPAGQLTWAVHISLAPGWFDPAETTGIITPFMLLYALHDALVKPMPGNPMAPSLAESWTMSPDGLSYEFVLRRGVKFHNGDPVTAEDVKFSMERYRGAASGPYKARIASIDVLDPQRVRFRFKHPWPDFMTFYGTMATGAGWIVPKKYVEKVGDDGFKKAPIGAGPFKFVSFTPGVELVLEANEHYWRKTPNVKRLVFKSIPDESTRLAMLKRGEADIAYSIRGALAEELKRTPGLTLKPNYPPGTFWLVFPEQWTDPKSPWADKRVRLAASYAIDRPAINRAETLGFSRITGSMIPHNFEFYWPAPTPVYDPKKAKQLLTEAGYPNGLDAGEYFCDASYANLGEGVVNYLQTAGIRSQLRPLERAAFIQQNSQKKLGKIIQTASGAFGNAATRLDAFVAAGGTFTYGTYPDIEGLLGEQASEMDPKKREVVLHRIQQLIHDKAMIAPIWELAFINGHGPRVAESGLTLITNHAYSAPYEDLKLVAK